MYSAQVKITLPNNYVKLAAEQGDGVQVLVTIQEQYGAEPFLDVNMRIREGAGWVPVTLYPDGHAEVVS